MVETIARCSKVIGESSCFPSRITMEHIKVLRKNINQPFYFEDVCSGPIITFDQGTTGVPPRCLTGIYSRRTILFFTHITCTEYFRLDSDSVWSNRIHKPQPVFLKLGLVAQLPVYLLLLVQSVFRAI